MWRLPPGRRNESLCRCCSFFSPAPLRQEAVGCDALLCAPAQLGVRGSGWSGLPPPFLSGSILAMRIRLIQVPSTAGGAPLHSPNTPGQGSRWPRLNALRQAGMNLRFATIRLSSLAYHVWGHFVGLQNFGRQSWIYCWPVSVLAESPTVSERRLQQSFEACNARRERWATRWGLRCKRRVSLCHPCFGQASFCMLLLILVLLALNGSTFRTPRPSKATASTVCE